jgi:hypothetical protein
MAVMVNWSCFFVKKRSALSVSKKQTPRKVYIVFVMQVLVFAIVCRNVIGHGSYCDLLVLEELRCSLPVYFMHILLIVIFFIQGMYVLND